MDRGLTNARDLAERVLGYTGGAGAPEVDAAAGAIVGALEELGRVVTSVHTTRSPGEFAAASSSLAQAGNPKLSPGLAGAFRAWPTAEARRRHDPTWEPLLQLDALEARLTPRDAVRLLPFVLRLDDTDAWATADPGECPTAAGLPAGTRDRAGALRAMRDVWRQQRRIRDRVLALRHLGAALAFAAPHVLGFSLHGLRERCSLVVLERPAVSLEGGLPHAWEQPAVRWPDGSGEWFWRGIRLPDSLAARIPALAGAEVASLRNVELRRLAVEYMGIEHFLRSCGAVRDAQDDFGTLWRTRLEVDGEPFVAVEVANSTAEPDGTYRRYFIRVPSWMRTAREAVAWTFGFDDADEYIVSVQT